MTSAPRNRQEQNPTHEDDRYGLDVLAAAIDDVAAQLPPSNLVPMTPPEPLSEAPQPIANAPSPPAWQRRLPALAAAVLIALLAWPAYLGWVHLPVVQQQLAEARSVTGPVDLDWLSPPRQGERAGSSAPPTQLTLPPEGSMVWILELPFHDRPRLRKGGRIELGPVAQDADVEQITEWTLDAVSLEHHLARHDGVPLLLRAGDLEPGRYRLQWVDPAGHALSAVDLELVTP